MSNHTDLNVLLEKIEENIPHRKKCDYCHGEATIINSRLVKALRRAMQMLDFLDLGIGHKEIVAILQNDSTQASFLHFNTGSDEERTVNEIRRKAGYPSEHPILQASSEPKGEKEK